LNRPLICVAGKNDIAVSALCHFLDQFPDHPLCFIPNANDAGVDSWQPSLVRHAAAWGVRRATLEELYDDPELRFFSLEFDKLIRVKRFASPRLFNFHFSKLPKYRGVYTAAHPILNGETESGVTLHLMDDGIDTGDIIDVRDVPIGPDDTVRDLYFNNLAAAKALFLKNVDRLVAGDFTARPQPTSGASYYSLKSIDYSAVRLDLRKTAFEIHAQVRAFAFREFQLPRYRGWGVWRSEITGERSTLRAGRLVEETDAFFRVASIDNDVLLHKDYQPQLWAAAERGDLAAAEAALAHVTDVDLRNRNGWSALIIAAYHGKIEMMRRLLAASADPDGTNYKGTSVLMYALSRYEQTREATGFDLVAAAARRLDRADHTGRTIHDWIAEKGLPELLERLPR
jgi:methionyl-tRNA formyltransferase